MQHGVRIHGAFLRDTHLDVRVANDLFKAAAAAAAAAERITAFKRHMAELTNQRMFAVMDPSSVDETAGQTP